MGSSRTVWHVLFAEILKECAPPGFEIQPEVQLSTEPQRADYIIVHRGTERRDGEARTLHKLWPLVPIEALVEYKSPSRGVRKGDLSRLIGYAGQYQAERVDRVPMDTDLVLMLVVASLSPTLDAELARFRWSREPLGDGYYRVDARPWALYVIVVDEVSRAEHDALLALVGRRAVQSQAADQWLVNHTVGSGRVQQMEKLEGYDELIKQGLAQLPARLRLDGLKPEERVAGLKPEERLLGLSADERILALPADMLAMLSTEAIAQLRPEVRTVVEQRLATFWANKAH